MILRYFLTFLVILETVLVSLLLMALSRRVRVSLISGLGSSYRGEECGLDSLPWRGSSLPWEGPTYCPSRCPCLKNIQIQFNSIVFIKHPLSVLPTPKKSQSRTFFQWDPKSQSHSYPLQTLRGHITGRQISAGKVGINSKFIISDVRLGANAKSLAHRLAISDGERHPELKQKIVGGDTILPR